MSPRFVHDSAAEAETSDWALAPAPAYNAVGLAHLVPSATSRRLRDAGPATFTPVPDDLVEGAFLARFAFHDLGARRARVFYVTDEYGEGLGGGIEASFVAQGGNVLGTIPVGDDVEIAALAGAAFRRARPDVVLTAGRSVETGELLRAVRAPDPRIPVVAGDGAYLPAELLRHSGGDLPGLYVVAFWVYDSTDATHRAFADRVRRTLGAEPMPEDALTEDALVRWLTGLGRDRPVFEGVTGKVSFGPRAGTAAGDGAVS